MISTKQTFGSLALASLLTISSISFADDNNPEAKKEEKPYASWDVLNPPMELNSIDISTDETTWSSLDVSPDGKRFVFDMLGDIFIASAEGGDAEPLTQDFAWNIHPSFSPDGKQVAFISDRDGLSNVWVMDTNGENLRQITKEKSNLIHSPKWSPDGEYIVVTKGIMSRRSIPAGEIWLYHKSGGSGLAIKERVNGKADQKNIADPAFSPDGRYIYFSRDITGGSTFSYNRDALQGLFGIVRYDRQTGEEETIISGTGGAVVPTPSPDGKYIAYVRRVKHQTALFLKELSTGDEIPLFLDLERDMQEGFGTEGYFAYFDWTPDAKNIMFWTGGKFHTINVKSKELKTLELTIKTTVQYADALRFDVDVAPDNFDVKAIRWAQKSPNGKSILFQALGKLYVKDIKSGKTKRLTRQDQHDEYYPRYSNDGKLIVYTTWSDEGQGDIRTVSSRGGKGKVVSLSKGHYIEPSFSTDGKLITYRKFTGGYLLDPSNSTEPGIYVLNLKEKTSERVARRGVEPHFSAGNDRIYFTESVGGKPYPETQFSSVNLRGEDKRVHLYGADKVSEYRLSLDKNWIAFVNQYNTFVAPFADNGKKISIGPTMSSLPVKQLSARSGNYMTWSPDNQSVGWSHGPRYFERSLSEAFDFIAEEGAELPEPVNEGMDLSFEKEFFVPKGYKAIVGGKVVTMRDADNTQEVIENGVVLIKGNRIEAVGTADDISIPKGALIVDAKGKTVIPGLVDTHAHGPQGRSEIIPEQNWTQYSNLAFGVTTIHDPSNDTTEIMAASELQRAGQRIAPRIYSTGTILYGAESLRVKSIINDYDDAFYHVRRLKDIGAISVKSYNQPRRDQRQQVLVAAKNQDMMVVPEGGGKFQQNISMLVDGHTGLEHSIPIANGYNDLTQLWGATKFGYTPTFVVAYGGLTGETYFYDRSNVWENERLMRYTPSFIVDRRIRRPKAPDEHYNHYPIARYAKTLRDNGVGVHIGAHGQREGLGAHWELWIMEHGGFTPFEALRGGTIDGARHLGMDKQLGSIEVGKLADLVVIDGDVLNDLSRSEYVEYTIINGRVFEAATMNELGEKEKRSPFFFEKHNNLFMPKQTQQEMDAKAHTYHWVH
ncbi:amidohydrolase family protein [Brumicola blandensis]|uniref:Amidohydrolase family protein n=1 Tax=Brumicola blandensis TaxID=3075611 RepID=A0AAW8R1E6_9ALTE|nr:amidohydrolase family protein [Alteromonas sp. W409]MDT0583077.1 amidohydrolase family protein [Alteromonas sp. W409]